MANDVFSLAWSLGGSISGEHGDGLVRAAFVKRQYGQEYYELLCRIKKIFDPEGLMNPGKIISSDADVMVRDLKAQRKILPERLRTELFFDADELDFEVDQCSGCGVCLSREASMRMCPVFRGLGEELGSSRAKANILRYWATGQLSEKEFESAQFRKFLDLCVNCKACSVQCPSGVDVSKLMTVARAQWARRKGLRWAELALSNNRYLSMVGSVFGPFGNFFLNLSTFKWVLEKAVGIDRRRGMPGFKRGSFLAAGRKYLGKCERIDEPAGKVAYFVDSYANYNDHELGFAVIDILRHNGIEVILPNQRPAPLPAIMYGDVERAKKDLAYSVKYLAKAVREGYKIICSEPSAALCLKDDLRHFVADDEARLVSENSYELMSYLRGLADQGKLKDGAAVDGDYVYHCPCHVLAAGGDAAAREVLEKVCGLKVADLGAGCCGLSGTFGMQKKNYDLSSKITGDFVKVLAMSAADEVLTECGACKMQIEHISEAEVTHPAKILAKSYGLL